MEKSNTYTKNTIILLIGKFTTQFMSLFLVPLYTRYLLTSDYGIVDLYQTYISLLVPILLLCLDSGIFRFLIDLRDKSINDKKKVISSVFVIVCIQLLLLFIIGSILSYFFEVKYLFWILTNISLVMLSNICLQVVRGLGQNIKYSIGSIITGGIILLYSIVSLVYFQANASSILIANSLGNFFCFIFLIFSSKLYQFIDFKFFSKDALKNLLKYSIPLIPNALSWWIVNASDRTIISLFLSASANGIYSVSCKFSNILNGVFGVFTMSWQESASLHIDDEDSSVFFSKMINKIFMLFVCISTLLISMLPFLFNILVGNDYIDSYKYIPILLLSNTFNVLIGLFGGIYIAKKMSKKLTTTTIIAAIINLVINLSMVKFIGLYASCYSTLISFLVMSIYRYLDVRKYVKVSIFKNTIFYSLLLFIISFFVYYNFNMTLGIIVLMIVSILSIFINREFISEILEIFTKKIRGR